MNKEIASYDSSFANRAKDKIFDMDKLFPKDKYIRSIQDTVIDEVAFDKNHKWYERSVISDFFNDNEIFLQVNHDIIILNEFNEKKINILCEDRTFLKNFLERPNNVNEKTYLDYRSARINSKKKIWNLIPTYNAQEIKIDRDEIYSVLEMHIGANIPLSFEMPTVSGHLIRFRIHNGNIYFSSSEEIYGKSNFKRFENLETMRKKFPTFYNLIVYDIFMGYLARPEGKITEFTININSTERLMDFITNSEDKQDPNKIELNENITPDLRISVITLHYIDFFVTCDRAQAMLLKYLFPQYKHKIKWCKPR